MLVGNLSISQISDKDDNKSSVSSMDFSVEDKRERAESLKNENKEQQDS
jgi:hypothetical protein